MMKKETVYPYDESFQKIAKKLPFRGAFLSLARTIQAKMQKEQTLPKGMKKRIFEVSGYQGLPVSVLEIWPSDLSQKPEVPWILDIHGGGFGYEMAEYQLLNACIYSKSLECRVFLPSYHLLPEYPYPAAAKDVQAVYQYLIEHAETFQLSRKKFLVMGDSAGAALAAGLVNDTACRQLPMPCGQVLLYPVADRRMQTESMKRYTDTPLWNAVNNRHMWELYLKDVPEEAYKEASPMEMKLPDRLPPAYIETTEFDCLRDEGAAYASRIMGIADTVRLCETKGTIHGYDMAMDSPVTKKYRKKRLEIMKEFLKGADL